MLRLEPEAQAYRLWWMVVLGKMTAYRRLCLVGREMDEKWGGIEKNGAVQRDYRGLGVWGARVMNEADGRMSKSKRWLGVSGWRWRLVSGGVLISSYTAPSFRRRKNDWVKMVLIMEISLIRGKELFVLCKLNICVNLLGKEICTYGF